MDGININPEVLAQTQGNILAQNAIHTAQLEAAVQQLATENQELRNRMAEMVDKPVEEDEDAATGTD